MSSTLERLLEQLTAFCTGAQDREALQRWFTPYQAALPPESDEDCPAPWAPDVDDRALFWALVWLFEDASVTEAEHRRVATRILACYEQLRAAEGTLRLLPLIRRQERLCQLVAKHQAGVISRIGMASTLRKGFRQEEVGAWLAAASSDTLGRVCKALAAGDYRQLDAWLSAPPA